MSRGSLSRHRSLGNLVPTYPPPISVFKGKDKVNVTPFEPCAATASLFLFAQGSNVLCHHHDTLAFERKFTAHEQDIQFISADNVSERGAGRLVVTYDYGQTAIVWDLFTGDIIARFQSVEPMKVAAWMRNGNIAFGNSKGEVVLFEPATSEHVSARTIFDPITALAPLADCKTYAIGYNNGSILLAGLIPSFTILHTLTATSRAPSPIVTLTWHASSAKQKSDMLATQTQDGDLRVWSVAKPPGSDIPRVIRVLKRAEQFAPGPNWITWAKNGRIVQFSQGETWSWDVRTKNVTYEPIPTVEHVQGITSYGATGVLFTIGPNYSIQQYDLDRCVMTANVQILPPSLGGTPFEEDQAGRPTHEDNDLTSPAPQVLRTNSEIVRIRHTNAQKERLSNLYGNEDPDPSATSFTGDTRTMRDPQPMYPSARSVRSTTSKGSKSQRKSRLRQEVVSSPNENDPVDLFVYTRARLSDVPYKQAQPELGPNVTTDDLRRQMLSVVFGWDADIRDLIRDELRHHVPGSRSAAYLSKWLNDDPEQLASFIGTNESTPDQDWIVLALSGLSPKSNRKAVQAFAQKMLVMGEAHTAATVLLAIGDRNEAIEVYVSRNYYLEAILLTCLATPHDWQRQSHLVRKWGEHVVANSQQQLAIRCFSCTDLEPSEQWTSPISLFNSPTSNLGSALDAARSPLPNLSSVAPPTIMPPRGNYRETQTPIAMPPPPTPLRAALTSGQRMTAKTSALTLITSFDTTNQYVFPGLKVEARSPTNGSVTPIAESAIPRSALSPIGGHGSFGRNHGMRSISSLLSPRPGTAGGLHRSRLSSIGETPVDVNPPSFPITRRGGNTTTSESDSKPESSADEGSKATPPTQSTSLAHEPQGRTEAKVESAKTTVTVETQIPSQKAEAFSTLPTLLTSARYEPKQDNVRETPLTAVAPKTAINTIWPKTFDIPTINEVRSADARPRTGSKSRKPENLSISMPPVQESSQNEEGEDMDSGMPTSKTAGSAAASYLESLGELTSPPTTGNSTRSAKSPSVSGRSLDKYISSLDEAQYYNQIQRSRTPQSMSNQSRDGYSEKGRTARPRADRNDSEVKTIPRAKRSPSSPVPMSPADLRRFNASVESFASAYQSQSSTTDPSRGGERKSQGHRSSSKGQSKRRQRSQSRQEPVPERASEQRRQDPRQQRGRSKTRKSDSEGSSPSSPRPLGRAEDDQGIDPALRLVAAQRELRHRSGSRRDGQPSRDVSPDRRKAGKRSRSRRTSDASANLPRRTSIGSRTDRQTLNRQIEEMTSQRPYEAERQDSITSLPSTRYESSGATNGRYIDHDRLKKELAAAELEARRLSLARRQTTPNIPTPGQSSSHIKSISTGDVNALSDSEYLREDDAASNSHHGSKNNGRGTPRAMPYPSRGQDPTIPDIPDHLETLLTANKYRPTEDLTRSISAPAGEANHLGLPQKPPVDLPRHPAFDHRVISSRSNSKVREASRDRDASRDRGPRQEYEEQYPIDDRETVTTETTTLTLPPLLPQLQHLASPPPPPPAPLQLVSGSLKAQYGADAVTNSSTSTLTNGHHQYNHNNTPQPYGKLALQTSNLDSNNPPIPPMPMSATNYTSPSPQSHRRGRSGNDSTLISKVRGIAGRMRSSSRGRANNDNASSNSTGTATTATTKSPNTQGSDYTTISPYDSIGGGSVVGIGAGSGGGMLGGGGGGVVGTPATGNKDRDNAPRHANEANVDVYSPYESIIPPDARVYANVSPNLTMQQGRWGGGGGGGE